MGAPVTAHHAETRGGPAKRPPNIIAAAASVASTRAAAAAPSGPPPPANPAANVATAAAPPPRPNASAPVVAANPSPPAASISLSSSNSAPPASTAAPTGTAVVSTAKPIVPAPAPRASISAAAVGAKLSSVHPPAAAPRPIKTPTVPVQKIPATVKPNATPISTGAAPRPTSSVGATLRPTISVGAAPRQAIPAGATPQPTASARVTTPQKIVAGNTAARPPAVASGLLKPPALKKAHPATQNLAPTKTASPPRRPHTAPVAVARPALATTATAARTPTPATSSAITQSRTVLPAVTSSVPAPKSKLPAAASVSPSPSAPPSSLKRPANIVRSAPVPRPAATHAPSTPKRPTNAVRAATGPRPAAAPSTSVVSPTTAASTRVAAPRPSSTCTVPVVKQSAPRGPVSTKPFARSPVPHAVPSAPRAQLPAQSRPTQVKPGPTAAAVRRTKPAAQAAPKLYATQTQAGPATVGASRKSQYTAQGARAPARPSPSTAVKHNITSQRPAYANARATANPPVKTAASAGAARSVPLLGATIAPCAKQPASVKPGTPQTVFRKTALPQSVTSPTNVRPTSTHSVSAHHSAALNATTNKGIVGNRHVYSGGSKLMGPLVRPASQSGHVRPVPQPGVKGTGSQRPVVQSNVAGCNKGPVHKVVSSQPGPVPNGTAVKRVPQKGTPAARVATRAAPGQPTLQKAVTGGTRAAISQATHMPIPRGAQAPFKAAAGSAHIGIVPSIAKRAPHSVTRTLPATAAKFQTHAVVKRVVQSVAGNKVQPAVRKVGAAPSVRVVTPQAGPARTPQSIVKADAQHVVKRGGIVRQSVMTCVARPTGIASAQPIRKQPASQIVSRHASPPALNRTTQHAATTTGGRTDSGALPNGKMSSQVTRKPMPSTTSASRVQAPIALQKSGVVLRGTQPPVTKAVGSGSTAKAASVVRGLVTRNGAAGKLPSSVPSQASGSLAPQRIRGGAASGVSHAGAKSGNTTVTGSTGVARLSTQGTAGSATGQGIKMPGVATGPSPATPMRGGPKPAGSVGTTTGTVRTLTTPRPVTVPVTSHGSTSYVRKGLTAQLVAGTPSQQTGVVVRGSAPQPPARLSTSVKNRGFVPGRHTVTAGNCNASRMEVVTSSARPGIATYGGTTPARSGTSSSKAVGTPPRTSAAPTRSAMVPMRQGASPAGKAVTPLPGSQVPPPRQGRALLSKPGALSAKVASPATTPSKSTPSPTLKRSYSSMQGSAVIRTAGAVGPATGSRATPVKYTSAATPGTPPAKFSAGTVPTGRRVMKNYSVAPGTINNTGIKYATTAAKGGATPVKYIAASARPSAPATKYAKVAAPNYSPAPSKQGFRYISNTARPNGASAAAAVSTSTQYTASAITTEPSSIPRRLPGTPGGSMLPLQVGRPGVSTPVNRTSGVPNRALSQSGVPTRAGLPNVTVTAQRPTVGVPKGGVPHGTQVRKPTIPGTRLNSIVGTPAKAARVPIASAGVLRTPVARPTQPVQPRLTPQKRVASVPPEVLAAAAAAAAAVAPTPPLAKRGSIPGSSVSPTARLRATPLHAGRPVKPTASTGSLQRNSPARMTAGPSLPISKPAALPSQAGVKQPAVPSVPTTPVKQEPKKEVEAFKIPEGMTFEDGEHVTMWIPKERRKVAGNAAPLGRNIRKYLREHPGFEIYADQDKDSRSGRKRPRISSPSEAADGDHVSIWQKLEKRKIAGNAAPLKKNLEAYFKKHPDCEVYVSQDIDMKNQKELQKAPKEREETVPAGAFSEEADHCEETCLDAWGHLSRQLENERFENETAYELTAALLTGDDNDDIALLKVEGPTAIHDAMTDLEKFFTDDLSASSVSGFEAIDSVGVGPLPPLQGNFGLERS